MTETNLLNGSVFCDIPHILCTSSALTLTTTKITLQFYHENASNIFGCLEWVVEDILPLNFVEKPNTRKKCEAQTCQQQKDFEDLFIKSQRTGEQETCNIGKRTREICLDVWSENSIHFIGCFLTVPAKKNDSQPEVVLLGFTPMDDETEFSAQNHKKFLEAEAKN